jgi:hypothetical protein
MEEPAWFAKIWIPKSNHTVYFFVVAFAQDFLEVVIDEETRYTISFPLSGNLIVLIRTFFARA